MEKLLTVSKIILLVVPISLGFSIISEVTKLSSLGIPPFLLNIAIDDIVYSSITVFPFVLLFMFIGILLNIIIILYRSRDTEQRTFLLLIGLVFIISLMSVFFFNIKIGVLMFFILITTLLDFAIKEIDDIKNELKRTAVIPVTLVLIGILGYLHGQHEAKLINDNETLINITYKGDKLVDNQLTLISNFSKGVLVLDNNKTKYIFNTEIQNIEFSKYKKYDFSYYWK